MGFWTANGEWPRRVRRWVSQLLVFCLAFSYTAWMDYGVRPSAAYAADPNVLNVTKTSPGKVLLGGQITYTVHVNNPNSYKVYNISLQDVVSSSRPNPQGRVSFVSASDKDGAVVPTTLKTDAVVSGDTTLTAVNIRDLAPGETYDLDLTFSVDPTKTGDPSWVINDLVQNSAIATGNQWPDGLGPVVPQSAVASATAKLVPITLNKTTNQSTAVDQASGTEGRIFTYTLVAQNNYTTQTASVVVTDTVPDGVEYLGMSSGATPTVASGPDTTTGVTTLVWNLGTLPPGATRTLVPRVGIRYDYYGTANGGVNRPTSSLAATHGAIIPHGTVFANGSVLAGVHTTSTVVTDASTSTVRAAYFTGTKSSSPGNGGPGTVITHTLTYYSSQYYSVIDSGSVAATAGSSIIVHDRLPDGQTLTTASASVAPDSITHNADGTTDIYWKRPELDETSQQTITFDAVVDDTWEEPGLAGQPVRAGDGMTNTAEFSGIWEDTVDATHVGNIQTVVAAAAAASFSTLKPKISKRVRDLVTGSWSTSASATVGDVLHFRVQFNASDTVKPLDSTVTKGNIEVTDWLPPGMSYVASSAVTTYSAAGDFSTPGTRTVDLSAPAALTIGGLNGVQWFLGDVAKPGWWECEFDAVVTNAAAIASGGSGDNMWKMTGVNSFGTTYSERDTVKVKYGEPVLAVAKTVVAPAVLKPGDACTYTVTITNSGSAAARDLVATDTIPAGMRNTTPTVATVTVGGVPRTNPGSWVTSYTMSTGAFVVDFNTAGVNTTIPVGQAMVITLVSSVDTTVGADRQMTNTVAVAYGSSDTTVSRPYAPVSANATVRLADASVTKSAVPTVLTIGDTSVYRIRSTVPTGGVLWWPRIDESIAGRGFIYVPGTARIVDVSGSPSVPATFAGGVSTPTTTTLTGVSTVYSWLLSDPIDNRGSASRYVFDLEFTLLYSGDSSGTALFKPPALIPAAHNSVNDSGLIYWNDATAAVRPAAPNQNAASANLATVIDQPWLLVTKANLNTTAPVGGSAVPYRITVANRGYATAHDILMTDVLPPAMRATTPTLGVVKLNGTTITPPAYVAPVWDSVTGSYTIDFYDGGAVNTPVSSGSTFTVDLTAYANVQPSAGQALVNTATVSWNTTTTPAIGRFYPMSLAPAPNTGVATATIALPTIQKYTLETSTQPGFPTEYRFRVTVPTETIVTDLEIQDIWSTNGFGAYMVPTSVDIAGNPEVGAVLTPPGVGDLNLNVPNPGSTFLFRYHPNPGSFTIDNADPASAVGDTSYAFEMRYKVGPASVPGTMTGFNDPFMWNPSVINTITDQASLSWVIGSVRTSVLSTAVSLPVKQPVLKTAKVPSISTVKGGDTVTFTVTVTNVGLGYAFQYDLGPSLVDTLPVGLINPAFVSATHSANGALTSPADYSVTIAGGVIKVSFNEPASNKDVLAPGQSIVYVYTAQVDPSIGAGTVLTNTADANWSSAFDFLWIADLQYNDRDVLEPTLDTTTAVLTVPAGTVVKAVGGSVPTATIGQTFSYTVTATVPANTTFYNAYLSDLVPDGVTVLGSSTSLSTGTVTIGARLPSGRTPVTWTVGDVSNPPTSTLALTLQVRVDDTYTAGGLPLDGLPAGVDGDAQDSLVNTAGVFWDTAKTGGSSRTATTPPVSVTVAEPHLREVKSASVATAAAGQTVTYTISVGNDGTSAAYNVAWSDLFDAWMVSAGSSPALVSVSIGGVPLVPAVDFTGSVPGANPVTLAFLGSTAIPVGATMTVVCTAAVNAAVAQNRSMVNTAAVGAFRSLPGAGRLSSGPTVTATVTAKAPGLVTSKSVVGDAFVQAGQLVQYRYTVSNVGSATATAVSFADAFSSTDFAYEPGTAQVVWPGGSSTAEPALGPGTVSWTSGSEIPNVVLAPSQTATLTFSLRVAAIPALGSKTDTATATAADLAGAPVPGASGVAGDTDPFDRSTASVTITRPHVAIDKMLAPAQDAFVPLGGNVSYAIRITNDGSSVLATVPLSDTFDSSRLAFVSAAPAQNTTGAGTIGWNDVTGAGTLAAGASTTVTVTLRVIAPGTAVPDTGTVTGALDVNGDGAPPASDTDFSATLTRPHVAVNKVLTSAPRVAIGGSVTYDIGITNDGDTTLTSVPASDTFPAARLAFVSASPAQNATGAGFVRWSDLSGAGDLAPGQTTTVAVTFTAIATGTAVPDTATVTGAVDVNGDTPPSASDVESALTITRPHLAVDKALAPGQDATVAIGGTVDYAIRITNDGETTVGAIPVTDAYDATRLTWVATAAPVPDISVLGQITWFDVTGAGSLAPGASTTVTVGYTVTATGAAIPDTATVAGAADEDGNPVPTVSDTDKTLTATRPHVAIDKMLAPGQDATVPIFGTITYAIRITNDGDTTLTTIPLTDAVWSMNATYVSAIPAADDTSAAIVALWNDVTGPGDLAPGQSVTVTVTFQPLMVAPIWNVAGTGPTLDVNGDRANDPLDAEISAFVTNPHVAVNKQLAVGQDPIVDLGDTVTYAIGVTNDGDTTLTTVPLDDLFDSSRLAFVSASPAESGVATPDVTWADITGAGDLAPGATTTVTVTFRLTAAGVAITDTATVTGAIDVNGDTPPTASDADAVLTGTSPHVAVAKQLAVGQDPFVALGGTVAYDIGVTNDGDTTLTTVPLDDLFDASRLAFVSASPAESGVATPDVIWADITGAGDLAPGQTTTVTVTFRVTAPGAAITDTATVAGAVDVDDDTPPTASDTDAVLTATAPHLAITKTPVSAQAMHVPVGGLVTWDIRVVNDGDTTMTTVALGDTYDAAHLAYLGAVPAEDSSASGSLSWNDLSGAGVLAPGDATTVTVMFRAIATVRPVVNLATVTGAVDVNGDAPPLPNATDTSVIVTRPSVAVAKALAPGEHAVHRVGDSVTYRLTVTNDGDTTLTTVPLADAFDDTHLAYESAAPSPDATSPATLTWNDITGAGSLAPLASVTADITFLVTAAGASIPDTASVNVAVDEFGDTPPDALDVNTVLGAYEPGTITTSKTADRPSGSIALPGETITYTVTYTNSSPVTITAASIVDTISPAAIYQAGSIVLDGLPQTDATGDDRAAYISGPRTVVADLGNVPPHASGALTFRVTVAAEELSRRGVLNVATLSGADIGSIPTSETFHPVDPFDITKTARDVNGGRLKPGDVIEWTISVTNTGLTQTTHVKITDTVPAGTTYMPGSMTGTGAVETGNPNLEWDIGTMGVDQTVVVTFRTRVNAKLPNNYRIRNLATVVSDQSLPKTSDNPATPGVYDPTVVFVRTVGDESTWMLLALLALFGAAALTWAALRRPRGRPAK